MKAKPIPLLIAAVLAALAAAGCGSDNKKSGGSAATSNTSASTQTTNTPASTGGGGEQVKLSADPSGQLKFDKTTLAAKAGKVTIVLDNPASVSHAIAVEGNGVDKDGQTVGKGGTSTVSVDLKPGAYTFYCPVPGHRQAGMQGKLTVK